MSLTGNLEDLPLLDILQIVSFSQKTGYLIIRRDEGDGAIVFSSGLVVAAFAWDSPLVPAGAPGPEIRSRIEAALARLARLHEGQFNFNLTDVTPQTVARRDISDETLDPGLNAQELLIDLARGIDEDRRDSSAALEASFADASASDKDDTRPPGLSGKAAAAASSEEQEIGLDSLATPLAPEPAPAEPAPPEPVSPEPVSPEPASPEPASPEPASPEPEPEPPPPASAPEPAEDIQTVLLVEDEEDIRGFLTSRFTQGGYQVVEAPDPDVAIKKAKRLGRSEIPFVLVVDLGMPTTGGSSFQGGFEVIKRLWKMNLRPPVLLMTESVNSALRARAKQMGVKALMFKPGLSRLDPAQFETDLASFANQIVNRTLPRLVSSRAESRAAKRAEPRPLAAKSAPEELSALQRRLRELREPGDATQISKLVMQVAREFFERGILFLIKEEEVRGLGGFGLAGKDENLNLLVRQLSIPLSEPSVFHASAASGKPFRGPLPDGRWNHHLMGRIGRFQSSEVVLLPLVAYREPIAILFGDNPESGRSMEGLETLEIFINQAAIALENTFLQRKLQSIEHES